MRHVTWKAAPRSTMLVPDGTRHDRAHGFQSEVEVVFCVTGMGIDGLAVRF